jgi:hypothetical protein
MQLSKRKPLDWFTELFTVGYLRIHTFSTIFIYAILVIAIIGFFSVITKFTFLEFSLYFLKLIFTFAVIYLIKLFFEKYKI